MAGIASDGGTYVAMTLTFVLSSQVSASLGYLLSVTYGKTMAKYLVQRRTILPYYVKDIQVALVF